MQTRQSIFVISVLAALTSVFTAVTATSAFADADADADTDTAGGKEAPIWEISIQSNVTWPPMPAPAVVAKKKKDDDKDNKDGARSEPGSQTEMITERTLQATLSGQLVAIAGDSVHFAPVLGAPKAVTIPIESVLALRKIVSPGTKPEEKPVKDQAAGSKTAKSVKSAEDNGERVISFRAGSSLPGRPLRVTENGLVLSFGNSGELTVPLAEIQSITPLRAGNGATAELPAAKGRHVARLTTGEIITGNIAPVQGERDRLTISSPILTGEFPLALVETLLFPEVDSSPEKVAQDDEKSEIKRAVLVSFSGGASLTSPTILLSDGQLHLEIWEGAPFQIPLSSAESISFIEQGGVRPNGPVLLWGHLTDSDDEFVKTRKALEGKLAGRELIVMNGGEARTEFDATLRRSSTFVWGEWESFDEDAFEATLAGEKGQSLDKELQAYVRSGGIAMFLGLSGGTAEQFARLGLGKVVSNGSIGDGSDLELTGPGGAFAPQMDGRIEATNSTMMYTVAEGSEWTPFVCQTGNPNNAAVIGRRLGSGWIFIMGMDFYETNENITRLLIELMRYRR